MKKKFVFLSLMIFLSSTIAGCSFNSSAIKSAVKVDNVSKESKTPSDILQKDQLKKILIHKTTIADLGINFSKIPGNSADIYLNKVGDPASGIIGEWPKKYNDPFRNLTPLTPEDQKLILEMAANDKFSVYPDKYPLPESVLELSRRKVTPLSTIRYMVYAATTTALELEKNGQNIEAEKILQAFVVIGRQMEESSFCDAIQWLVGIAVEKTATKGLVDFYNRNSEKAKALKFENYLKEIEVLKSNINNSYTEKDMLMVSVGIGSFGSLKKAKLAMKADDGYFPDNISESDFNAWLDSLKIIDDKIIQIDLLWPLLYLKNASDVPEESAKAVEILTQYSQSDNFYIAKYAKNALEISKKEFDLWIKDNK